MRPLVALLAASALLLPGAARAQQPDPPSQPPAPGQPAPVLSATDQGLTLRAAMPSLNGETVQYGRVYLSTDKDNVLTASLKVDAQPGEKEKAALSPNDPDTYTLHNVAGDLATLQQPLALYFEIKRVPVGVWGRTVVTTHFRPVGEWRRIHDLVTSFLKELDPVFRANEHLRRASYNLMFNLQTTDDARQQEIERFLRAVEDAKSAAYDALLLDVTSDAELAAQGMVHKYINDLETDTRDYLALKANDPAVKTALAALQASGMPLTNKNFYGISDNYRPEVLAMGVRWTRATVSILKQGQKVGTGALIGKNLVLTCWHCVNDGQPFDPARITGYKVEFFDDHRPKFWTEFLVEEYLPPDVITPQLIAKLPPDLQKQLPPGFEFPQVTVPRQPTFSRACRVLWKNDLLDYCLLDISPSNPADLSEQEILQMQAIGRIKPITLVKGRAGFMTPLYVLGYPQGGNLTVHDNSWVIFPLDIDAGERALIHRKLAQSTLPEYEPYSPETINTLKIRYKRAQKIADEQLASHYPPPPAVAGQLVRHHFGGEAHIGLESDTFQGDSGAPVISRRLGGLIGILRRGDKDTHVATKNTTAYARRITSTVHEEAIPIELIINDVKQQLGDGWKKTYAVDIED